MTTESRHPAVQANINSINYATQGDKEAWLALYDDNALVQDPVGKSPFDSTGEGHQGKAAIEKFWDTVIGPSNITITVTKRCPSGSHTCAVFQTAVNDLGNGIKTSIDMIVVYEVNDAGKIIRMSAYWDWDTMVAQLKKLGFM